MTTITNLTELSSAPDENDVIPIVNLAAQVGTRTKKTKWSTLKVALKTVNDALYATVSHSHDSPSVTYTQDGTGAIERTLEDKAKDTVDAREFGVVVGVDIDNTDELNLAFEACNKTTGTVELKLPPGWIRADGQLLINTSGLTVSGQGRSAANASWGTVLDLRYSSGHAAIIAGASQKLDIAFENMHIYQGNGGNYYAFESRYVRGLSFRNITFGGVYGFLKAGRSAEPSLYVTFDGIEGNMRESGTPVHEHFMDAVNVPGMLFFTGHGHVEGYTTWPDQCAFLNYGATSVVVDGAQIGNWTLRNFSKLFNFQNGVGNFFANGVIGDFCDYGFYADSDSGEIIGVNLNGCRFAGGPSSTGISHGIVIAETGNLVESIQINNCLIRDFGRYGIWLDGDMDVVVTGNKIQNVGQQTTNTYDGIRIGTDVSGIVTSNLVHSYESNVHRYGIMIDSDNANLIVQNNVSIGHGTFAIGNDERGSAATRIVRDNSEQGSLGKYILGPWGLENVTKSVSDDPLYFQMGGGSVNTQHFRAIRRGRIIGISAASSAAVVAGEMSCSAGINGAVQSLTAVLDSTRQYNTLISASGIAFNAGDSLSIRYTTDGSWNPETSDILAFLEIIDD